MKKIIKTLVLVLALTLVLTGCQYLPELPEIPGLSGTEQGHTHTLVHFEAKAPTCVNNGILEHWYCPGCNARFSDEAANTEVAFADLEVEELGHTPAADDGDCTTAVACTVCDGVATKAVPHTPEEDDGDCTTNVMCAACAKVAVPGNAEHEASEDDGDCTTAVKCAHCDVVVTAAAEAHTPGDAATCTTAQTCTVCGTEVAPATGHTFVDGACSSCGLTQTTVTVSVGDYATANSWENGTLYNTLVMDANVSVGVVSTKDTGYAPNSGKYYTSGTNWRMYQTETPEITVKAAEGKTIVSVKITYIINKTGILTLNGENVDSDTVVTVNANSVVFSVGNTGDATNGQVRITSIEVIYY